MVEMGVGARLAQCVCERETERGKEKERERERRTFTPCAPSPESRRKPNLHMHTYEYACIPNHFFVNFNHDNAPHAQRSLAPPDVLRVCTCMTGIEATGTIHTQTRCSRRSRLWILTRADPPGNTARFSLCEDNALVRPDIGIHDTQIDTHTHTHTHTCRALT